MFIDRLRPLVPRSVKQYVRHLVNGRTSGLPTTSSPEVTKPGTSQADELAVICSLLRQDFPRWFIDVGAHDGVTFSNSRSFVEAGWTCLLVEPHPTTFATLTSNSSDWPNALLVQCAVSSKPGQLPLYIGRDQGLMNSTLSTDDNRWMHATRSSESVLVKVETLTDLLQRHGFPRDISVLSIDTEGMDYDVLVGLDIDRFRPRIIVTEEYLLNLEKHNAKYRLLLDLGYAFFRSAGYNTVWIANEWVARCIDAQGSSAEFAEGSSG